MSEVTLNMARYHVVSCKMDMEMQYRKDSPRNADYIQLSEPVEVVFTDMPAQAILDQKLGALDDQIERVNLDHHTAINDLEQRKQELLALPSGDSDA